MGSRSSGCLLVGLSRAIASASERVSGLSNWERILRTRSAAARSAWSLTARTSAGRDDAGLARAGLTTQTVVERLPLLTVRQRTAARASDGNHPIRAVVADTPRRTIRLFEEEETTMM